MSADPIDDIALSLQRAAKFATYNIDNSFVSSWFSPFAALTTVDWFLRKVDGYELFRGTCNLRAVVNASPFHYGQLVLASFPEMSALNTGTGNYVTDPLGWTQQHSIIIDVARDKSVELQIPFIYKQPYITLTTGGTSLTDMCAVRLGTLAPLRQIGLATPNPIDVTFYVWFTDVELKLLTPKHATETVRHSGPFSHALHDKTKPPVAVIADKPKIDKPVVANIPKDSKDKNVPTEATKGGPVTYYTSVASQFTDKFKDIPVIGKFAQAASLGLGAASKIASLWGFSRPIHVESINPVQRDYFGDLSISVARDTCKTLTLDPLAQVTLSPESVGIPSQDSLAIFSIASRFGMVGQFDWSTADDPDALLITIPVIPTLVRAALADNGTPLTPLAHISYLFEKWRGPLVFRFDFISSPMLKGRVQIRWVPRTTQTLGGDNYNAQTQKCVVDLSERTCIDVIVGWGRVEPYMNTELLDWDTTSVYANGYLYVDVLNRLSTPMGTVETVTCNVYTKAYEGFELMGPQPLTGVYVVSTDAEFHYDDILPCFIGGNYDQPSPADKTAGEHVASLRALFKRYTTSYQYTTPSSSSGQLVSISIPGCPARYHAPVITGFSPRLTPLAFIAKSFLYQRGRMRFKIVVRERTQASSIAQTGDHPSNVMTYVYNENIADANATVASSTAPVSYLHSLVGNEVFDNAIRATEFQHDLHTGEWLDYTSSIFVDNASTNFYSWNGVVFSHTVGPTTNLAQTTTIMSSIGEDFNLFYYGQAPYMYDG